MVLLSLRSIFLSHTMSKQPKLMSLPRVRDILQPHNDEIRHRIYIDQHLAVIRNSSRVLPLIIQQQPPFTSDDRRFSIIVSGQACVNVNLVDKQFAAGMLVFFGPGTIISPVSISDDFELCGFGIPLDFPLPFQPDHLPQAFNGHVRDFQLTVSQDDQCTARHILNALWQVVHRGDYNLMTASNLIAAQMHHYDALFRQHSARQITIQAREQTLFDRFIYLVNQHAPTEHQIGFYARKMCLTERYLGTVIRQVTGVTAKQWIDRALVTRIKVELRHSDKSVAQIAEAMNFPNPSFLAKYFKRLTSMTPAEFRKS